MHWVLKCMRIKSCQYLVEKICFCFTHNMKTTFNSDLYLFFPSATLTNNKEQRQQCAKQTSRRRFEESQKAILSYGKCNGRKALTYRQVSTQQQECQSSSQHGRNMNREDANSY